MNAISPENIENCKACRSCLKDAITENGWPVLATRMILCPVCGCKRCPKATNHKLDCIDSNERGQEGSDYQ